MRGDEEVGALADAEHLQELQRVVVETRGGSLTDEHGDLRVGPFLLEGLVQADGGPDQVGAAQRTRAVLARPDREGNLPFLDLGLFDRQRLSLRGLLLRLAQFRLHIAELLLLIDEKAPSTTMTITPRATRVLLLIGTSNGCKLLVTDFS